MSLHLNKLQCCDQASTCHLSCVVGSHRLLICVQEVPSSIALHGVSQQRAEISFTVSKDPSYFLA